MCLRLRRQLVVFHGAINAQQLPFKDSTCHLAIITCHLDIIIDTNTYAAMLHFRCSAQHLPLIVLSSARFGANIWGRRCWSMVESTVQLLLAHQAGRRTKPSVSLRNSCSTVLLMLKQDRFKQRSINVCH